MRVTLTFNGLIGLPLSKPIIILSQTFYKNLWNKMKEKVLNDELFNMFRILKQHFFIETLPRTAVIVMMPVIIK